jgi:formylglycine-generating enzyme required for sulfatase activity
MLGIGATSFHLGSNRSPEVRGAPRVHEAKLGAFCIDRTEVTVAAYKRCVDAGKCAAPYSGDPDDLSWVDEACNQLLPERLGHPVNCVDWKQAQAYCRWAGKRLPTQEEWELAAGRLDGRKFAWGNAPPGPDKANLRGGDGDPERPLYAAKDGWRWTAPVGSFPADTSPFGLVDMGGNVSEWTSTVDADWKWVFVSGGDFDVVMELRERVLIAPHDSAPMSGIRCTKGSLR